MTLVGLIFCWDICCFFCLKSCIFLVFLVLSVRPFLVACCQATLSEGKRQEFRMAQNAARDNQFSVFLKLKRPQTKLQVTNQAAWSRRHLEKGIQQNNQARETKEKKRRGRRERRGTRRGRKKKRRRRRRKKRENAKEEQEEERGSRTIRGRRKK